MPAYVIVEISVTNKEAYEEYKTLAADSIAFYGGKYLIRGGKTETLEGNWHPERLVMLEFPSFERASEWYNSGMYAIAKPIRLKNAKSRMLLVEGL